MIKKFKTFPYDLQCSERIDPGRSGGNRRGHGAGVHHSPFSHLRLPKRSHQLPAGFDRLRVYDKSVSGPTLLWRTVGPLRTQALYGGGVGLLRVRGLSLRPGHQPFPCLLDPVAPRGGGGNDLASPLRLHCRSSAGGEKGRNYGLSLRHGDDRVRRWPSSGRSSLQPGRNEPSLLGVLGSGFFSDGNDLAVHKGEAFRAPGAQNPIYGTVRVRFSGFARHPTPLPYRLCRGLCLGNDHYSLTGDGLPPGYSSGKNRLAIHCLFHRLHFFTMARWKMVRPAGAGKNPFSSG